MKIKYKIKWCFRFRLSRTQFASQQWAPAVSPLPPTCSVQVSSSTIIFIKLSLTCMLNTGGENGKDACGVSFFLDWYLLSLELVISDDNESWVTIYFTWWWLVILYFGRRGTQSYVYSTMVSSFSCLLLGGDDDDEDDDQRLTAHWFPVQNSVLPPPDPPPYPHLTIASSRQLASPPVCTAIKVGPRRGAI